MLFFRFCLCAAVAGAGLWLFNRYGIDRDNDLMTIGAFMAVFGTVGATIRLIWGDGR